MNITILLIGLGIIIALFFIGKVFSILTKIFLVIVVIFALIIGFFVWNSENNNDFSIPKTFKIIQ